MMLINSIPGLVMSQSQFGLVVSIETLLPVLITTIVFVLLGLIIFALAFFVITKVTPFSVRKEIEDDQNVALAVVIASIILGSALIIAAAIHG